MANNRENRSSNGSPRGDVLPGWDGYRTFRSCTKQAVFRDKFKSGWEAFVARSLSRNSISFEYEPRSFQLSNRLRYTPDFVLSLQRQSRRIIIEPHGIMNHEDFQKFSLFREVYGDDYFLVLLVRNNSIPFVSEEAYDYIWPIEYVDLLFKKLRHDSIVGREQARMENEAGESQKRQLNINNVKVEISPGTGLA